VSESSSAPKIVFCYRYHLLLSWIMKVNFPYKDLDNEWVLSILDCILLYYVYTKNIQPIFIVRLIFCMYSTFHTEQKTVKLYQNKSVKRKTLILTSKSATYTVWGCMSRIIFTLFRLRRRVKHLIWLRLRLHPYYIENQNK
jgi:hypothetical protein